MNLTPKQIIPTITFFQKIKIELFESFCENYALLNGDSHFEYCSEDWNYHDKSWKIKTEFKNVNLSFLKYLCEQENIETIEFEQWKNYYRFECNNGIIYSDVKKKYLI